MACAPEVPHILSPGRALDRNCPQVSPLLAQGMKSQDYQQHLCPHLSVGKTGAGRRGDPQGHRERDLSLGLYRLATATPSETQKTAPRPLERPALPAGHLSKPCPPHLRLAELSLERGGDRAGTQPCGLPQSPSQGAPWSASSKGARSSRESPGAKARAFARLSRNPQGGRRRAVLRQGSGSHST